MLESDADRLAMIQAVGEPFTTSRPEKLWLIFDKDFIASAGLIPVAGDQPVGVGRTSDVRAHELVRESKITRDSDDAVYFVELLRHDGTGITAVVLRQ